MDDPPRLFITMKVPDRDTGETINLGGIRCEAAPAGLSEPELIAWVYREIEEHVLHELREAFHVDGVRVLNPHVGEETL